MRTTLELPDPLFARLKARAAMERVTLKQLLRSFVEQGLDSGGDGQEPERSTTDLPRISGALPIPPERLNNAGLFSLLEE